MKVQVFDLELFPMSGIATSDFPFNQRPSSFSAWLKTTIMPGDAVYVIVSMWKEETNSNTEFMAGLAYPNPASGRLFIPITVNQSTSVEVDLFDQRGSRIRTSRFESLEPGRHDLEIPADNLAAGLYTYRLTSEGTPQTGKFMIINNI